MKGSVILLFSFFSIFLFNSCSSSENEVLDNAVIDEADDPIQETNNSPVVMDQSFSVLENNDFQTIIGKIAASDPDGDPLEFLTADEVEINKDTGEFSLAENGPYLLDYETNDSFLFDIIVSDGKTSVTARITVQIEDVDDGPLRDTEKRIVRSFMFQVQYDQTDYPLYKRTEKAQMYLSGFVTNQLRSVVSLSIQEYNSMFSDGFEISVIDDSLTANVTLHSGTIEELEFLWPDYYELALRFPGLGGIAGGDRVWIADYAHNSRTIKHELGHMIGLGHSPVEECGFGAENSIMCGGVGGAGNRFNEIDVGVIQYYYHPDMPLGLPGTEVVNRLSEIIISER
ncbi:Ig-like domain-containing protein [Eudoraea chungangensis]|uniref:Ig-like domain-containing protein n=1 Tax=Eudoraea chungangensis TaxID=1481905 RepID=UPI0023EC6617|nr:hypothetical protein [Eudoraea chungangensis]